MGTLTTTIGLNGPYQFSALNFGLPATTGIQGAIHVRTIFYQVASGMKKVSSQAWTWFEQYVLNNPVPTGSWPQQWSQYTSGAAPGASGSEATGAGGSFYINVPDATYTLTCDCVCYPVALIDDTTPEVIPYLWTDCVPYFAAYMALLSSQMSARRAEAEAQFSYYQTFVERARAAVNPSTNKWQYQQQHDPVQMAKLGMQQKRAGGQGG